MRPRSPRPGARRSSSTASNASSRALPRLRRGSDVSARELFQRYFGECPLIAIIRGVTPDAAEAIGDAIYDSGIRIIEVPLNSPDPFTSIERLAAKFGERMLVGGGTVLSMEQVHKVQAA